MGTARSSEKSIPALTTPLQVEIPPLAPGELERLSVEYALSHEPKLREVLVLHHQRLVRSIASRFLGAGEALEDLIQVGNIGLINALITVVGIEFLIGYGGLGALIPDLADRFEIPAMYGAIVFVILVSACLQLVVRRLERWLRLV